MGSVAEECREIEPYSILPIASGMFNKTDFTGEVPNFVYN